MVAGSFGIGSKREAQVRSRRCGPGVSAVCREYVAFAEQRKIFAFCGTPRRAFPSAPVKAFDQEGESPFQANVTGLKSTVVTAFPRGKVESNLRRTTSP